jgi:SAM-dependent methyltransferase
MDEQTLDDLYTSPPPWDLGRPQRAFQTLAEQHVLRGPVLDAGCGTGEHALMAAGLGLDATGVELSSSALRIASRKARERGLNARFVRHDLLRLPELGGTFGTVLDSLVFHVFDDQDRPAYVAGLGSVLGPGGRFFTLCLRDPHPDGRTTPRDLTPDEIEAAFTSGWRVDSIEPATIESTHHPEGLRGWFAAATKLDHPDAGR